MSRKLKNPHHPLARLRLSIGITREELADKTGVHASSIRDIEHGKFKITPRTSILLSKPFGVKPGFFIELPKVCPTCGQDWNHNK
jgi:transcriptional regulator with XRE-family HTH domain